MGPCPITYEGIVAFERLCGVRFTPWEVETIEELDAVWLVDQVEKQKVNKSPESPPEVGSHAGR